MNQGWNLRSIYLYLVSLVTLLMILFGLVAFAGNLARFIFPTHYIYYPTLMDIEREYLDADREAPPIAELERIRDQRIGDEVERNKAYRMRDLVGTTAVWLIPIPFYLYHWGKIKKELLPPRGGEAA